LTLPATDAEGWDDLPSHPEVAEQVALVMAAKAKEEAVLAFDLADYEATRAGVDLACAHLMGMPQSPTIAREIEEVEQLKADLDANNGAKFRKRTTAQAYRRNRGHES
jgi:Ca-activated chloride channel family protein